MAKDDEDKAEEEEDEEQEEEEEDDANQDLDDDDMRNEIVDVDDIYADIHDDVDMTLFSQDALIWAERNLGNAKFAKYYPIAKERSRKDIQEMIQKREWKVQIRNIRYDNHGETNDIFLQYNFGWNFSLTRKLQRVKGDVPDSSKKKSASKKKKKSASGLFSNIRSKAGKGQSQADKKTTDRKAQQRWVWVKHGSRGHACMTKVRRNVEKGTSVDFDQDSFSFTWYGSYFDLFKKKLHVEVWDWNEFQPNEYLASYEMPLRLICSGEMNQAWDIMRTTQKRGKKENSPVGGLKFQCIVQEVLSYTLKMQNWSAIIDLDILRNRDGLDKAEAADIEAQNEEFIPYIVFNLHKPSHIHSISSHRSQSRVGKMVLVPSGQQRVVFNFGQLPVMKFHGTRLDLEGGMLYVDVYDQDGPVPYLSRKLLASAQIPLKSVMENGSLSSRAIHSKSSRFSVNCYCPTLPRSSLSGASSSNLRNSHIGNRTNLRKDVGSLYGSMDVDVDPISHRTLSNPFKSPRTNTLWREFAQLGELQPAEIHDYPPYNYSYLVIKIIDCRNLIAADANGLSDPYVTIQWGDQRLSTRWIPETLDPTFNEEMYFLVRAFDPLHIKAEELAREPVVIINVWDHDDTGASDLLGTAKFYLHQITGCGHDVENGLPVRAAERVKIRKRLVPGGPLTSTTIYTRVYRADLALQGLPRTVESFIHFEAYFRGPDGDLQEKDPNVIRQTGSELLCLPDLFELEHQLSKVCLCHPNEPKRIEVTGKDDSDEHYVYRRETCPSYQIDGRCIRFLEAEDGLNRAWKSVRSMEAAEEKAKRASNLGMIQSYNNLSQYVTDFSNNNSNGGDGADGDGEGSDSRKILLRNKIHDRVVEYQQASDLFDFIAENQYGDRHWLPTFLQKMTPPKPMIIGANELARMLIVDSGKPNSCFNAAQLVKAMEFMGPEDVENLERLKRDTIWMSPDFFLMMKKGDVKAHALLLCNLFLGLNTDAYVCLGWARVPPLDNDPAIIALKEEQRKGKIRKAEYERRVLEICGEDVPYAWVMTRENNSDCCGEAFESTSGPNGAEWGGAIKFWDVTSGRYYYPLPNRWSGRHAEDELRQATEKRRKTKKVNEKKLKEQDLKTPQAVKSKASTTEEMLRENLAMKSKFVNEQDLLNDTFSGDVTVDIDQIFEVGAGVGDGWGQTSSVTVQKVIIPDQTPAKEALIREREEALRKVEGIQNPSGISMAQFHETRRWIENRQEIEAEQRKRIPYSRCVAVFNHENLWINTQATDVATEMQFDMEKETGWLPILRKEETDLVRSHYPARNVGPLVTQERVSELQKKIQDEIEAGMYNTRASRNISTSFAGPGMSVLIQSVLQRKHELYTTDRIKANGWNSSKQCWERDPGLSRYQEYQKALRVLLLKTPTGFKFRLSISHLNTSSPEEIRKLILTEKSSDPNSSLSSSSSSASLAIPDPSNTTSSLFFEAHRGMEMYGVGVTVIPMYNSTLVVHVGIVCIFPTKEFKEASEKAVLGFREINNKKNTTNTVNSSNGGALDDGAGVGTGEIGGQDAFQLSSKSRGDIKPPTAPSTIKTPNGTNQPAPILKRTASNKTGGSGSIKSVTSPTTTAKSNRKSLKEIPESKNFFADEEVEGKSIT